GGGRGPFRKTWSWRGGGRARRDDAVQQRSKPPGQMAGRWVRSDPAARGLAAGLGTSLLFLLRAVLDAGPRRLALQNLQHLAVEAVAGAGFLVFLLLLGDVRAPLLVQVAGLVVQGGALLVELVQVRVLLLERQLAQLGR